MSQLPGPDFDSKSFHNSQGPSTNQAPPGTWEPMAGCDWASPEPDGAQRRDSAVSAGTVM